MDRPSQAENATNIQPETVNVELGARRYDIHVGEQLLASAGKLIAPVLKQPRVIIVTDTNVAPIYLETLEGALTDENIAHHSIILPAGEQTKSFQHLEELIDGILDAQTERGTTLIALGGGVIGDITGLAAAITLRGLDFVQIPTTLLAQVDSSVGGKTGIDTRHGKNLVGSFHQPRLVLADTGTLDTLPERELRAGYAEVVKYGLIKDDAFFAWLEKNGVAICAGDKNAQRQAIVTCCKAKAEIVAADEHESGQRALLNFGHTFAHAFEAQTGYSDRLLHGEAVAIGMSHAFALSHKLELCDAGETTRVNKHLSETGLPSSLKGIAQPSWSAEALLGHMSKDKKVRDGHLTFILARRIGDAFISHDVDNGHVKALLEETLAA